MDKTARISFYSTMFFSILIIILDIFYLNLFANPNQWIIFEKYVASYKFVEVLPEIIGFILLPTFLITINGIILNNHIENTHTPRISNFFATEFVIIVSVGYFIQFAVVYPNIHAENNKIYELWLFGNTEGSLAWFIIIPAAFLRVTYLFSRILKNQSQQI